MGRLIEETELEKYIMHDGCEKGCGYIDERDLKYIPTVEAIPKADYETRLKADLVAILDEIDLELAEQQSNFIGADEYNESYGVQVSRNAIREKINALKAESEGE